MNAAQFRQDFPEFANADTYPDSAITLWLGLAGIMLNEDRWGTLLPIGTELFIAHHLVLASRDLNATAAGGTPGGAQGIMSAKAVDKVSVSYDSASISLTDGGFWNSTLYGIRFLQFARMIGAGGIQL